MAEQLCRISDEIELCYETFGDPADPPALLIMGLATQMVGWHEDFCEQLAGRGFHPVRFDNRDAGRSTHIDCPPPSVSQLLLRKTEAARYTLDDMADDAAGLLRELGLGPAHVIGASMGGMIAQTLAARHPELVRSLVSIMSTTGNRRVGQPALRVYPLFVRRPAESRDQAIRRIEKVFKLIGSRGLPQDPGLVRDIAERSWDRDHDPHGPGRQVAAIMASGDRTPALEKIQAPTLVIHGNEDLMVRPSGGYATARAIEDARLMVIDGMGHDLPRAAWPRIIDGIASNAERAAEPVARAA